MSQLRHLRAADHRVMPWKNGLGTTTEIAIDPPGAGLDAFTWRISIADLGASGPFSTFAGYERILVQIEGEPMTLSHQGGGEHRLTLLVPYRFAGELATYGELTSASARDFNVMVRRDRASADLVVRELSAGSFERVQGQSGARMVFVLRGSMSAPTDGEGIEVGSGEMLLAPPGVDLAMVAGPEGATALLISIAPA